jgi:drug/metabolite transporter, DME family
MFRRAANPVKVARGAVVHVGAAVQLMPSTAHVLALTSALISAMATVFIRHGLRGSNPYTGFWINVVVGTVVLWTAVFATGGPTRISPTGLGLFVLAGLLGTVGGRLLRFVSIEQIGAPIAAALTGLNPLIASGLAILLLGERVTWPIVLGTVLIVAGTALLSVDGRHVGVRPVQLVIPLLSATFFGVVAILRKLALSQTGPVLGTAVNATAAFVAFTIFLAVAGQRRAFVCRGRSLAYFVAAGLAENTSVFLTIVALSVGTVSVVMPLTGSAPIFVLLLSVLFLKGIDRLTPRIVLGTLLIVLGVYLVTALGRH